MKLMYPGSLLRQFLYESDEWGRLLAFLKQENVFCKSRLAEIVSTVDNDTVLITAEKFNDEFLSHDRMINFLTEEVKKHNKLLQKDFYVDGELLNEVIRNQKRLRNDIQKGEDLFSQTRKDFSEYLTSLV